MPAERRVQRSDDAREATALYLQSLAGRTGHEAIAVASQQGRLLGGVGDGFDLEHLGALASLSRPREADAGAATHGRPMRRYCVKVRRQLVFLACVGDAPFPLSECTAALQRIHGPDMAERAAPVTPG